MGKASGEYSTKETKRKELFKKERVVTFVRCDYKIKTKKLKQVRSPPYLAIWKSLVTSISV